MRRRAASALGVLLLAPAAVVVALLVVIPLSVLVWFSIAPEGPGTALSLANYARLVSGTLYIRLAIKTLITAGAATLLTAALAWAPAWAISRLTPRARTLTLFAIIVPYLTSYLLLIYSIFVVIGRGSPLLALLHSAGLIGAHASILYTPTATLVMLVYENLPLMLFVLFSGMQRIDADLLTAARSLGATRIACLREIILPLAAPSLAAGLVMVFVPMGGAFVEPQILGGPNGLLLGNVIADQMTRADNASFGSVLSILLLVGMLALGAVATGVMALARRVAASHRIYRAAPA